MAAPLRLRALVRFYRLDSDGRYRLIQPGEVFRAPVAEAVDLMSWQRAELADAGEAAKFNAPTNDWRRMTTRDA